MPRTRNFDLWKNPFYHHDSLSEFLHSPFHPGGHSIRYNDRYIDLLVESRNSETTLVVFNAAISLSTQSVPYFSGLNLAKSAQTNLVAISDPTLHYSQLSIAWYLGDSHTGPLQPIIGDILQHVIGKLGSKRTILFGASGGGYAAAHLATNFPDSIAVAINPRLALDRRSKHKMASYLKHAHNLDSTGLLGDTERTLLADFGPIRIEDYVNDGLNHDLLIYQNLLDFEFIEHQLTPFIAETYETDRLWLQYSVDQSGHVAIPSHKVNTLLGTLTTISDQKQAIQAAGFVNIKKSHAQLLHQLPKIGTDINHLIKQKKDLEDSCDSTLERLKQARTSNLQYQRHIQRLTLQNERLRQEPSLFQRLWRVIPQRIRAVVKKIFRMNKKPHRLSKNTPT